VFLVPTNIKHLFILLGVGIISLFQKAFFIPLKSLPSDIKTPPPNPIYKPTGKPLGNLKKPRVNNHNLSYYFVVFRSTVTILEKCSIPTGA